MQEAPKKYQLSHSATISLDVVAHIENYGDDPAAPTPDEIVVVKAWIGEHLVLKEWDDLDDNDMRNDPVLRLIERQIQESAAKDIKKEAEAEEQKAFEDFQDCVIECGGDRAKARRLYVSGGIYY